MSLASSLTGSSCVDSALAPGAALVEDGRPCFGRMALLVEFGVGIVIGAEVTPGGVALGISTGEVFVSLLLKSPQLHFCFENTASTRSRFRVWSARSVKMSRNRRAANTREEKLRGRRGAASVRGWTRAAISLALVKAVVRLVK